MQREPKVGEHDVAVAAAQHVLRARGQQAAARTVPSQVGWLGRSRTRIRGADPYPDETGVSYPESTSGLRSRNAIALAWRCSSASKTSPRVRVRVGVGVGVGIGVGVG